MTQAGQTGVSARRAPASRWSALAPEQALSELATSRAGLDAEEASRRLKHYGPNRLPEPARRPWHREMAANLFHLFAVMLWVAAAIAWILGTPELAFAIVGVILVNGLFSFWQEYQAERAVEALAAMLPQQVAVRRANAVELISTAQVVPGDILILTEGEAIPADARLIAAQSLRVDNSSLSGESRPVPRIVRAFKQEGYVDIALPNLVFAGGTVAGGYGEAVVFATGGATEFGRIAELTRGAVERPSPLQLEVIRITRVIAVLSLIVGVGFFALATAAGGLELRAGFLFALGLLVANVPEGLLPTLTLALAMAVQRMARRNAIVKRLAAVETLGATNVILTDKTGTLTENEMTVRELWLAGARYLVGGTGYRPVGEIRRADGPETEAQRRQLYELLQYGALCCDARLKAPHPGAPRWTAIGDPTEASILVAAAKIGLTPARLSTWPRITELPFDSVRKRMATIQVVSGAPVAAVKGALSHLLPLCSFLRARDGVVTLDEAQAKTVSQAHDAMAQRGLRVLAVAMRQLGEHRSAEEWRVHEVERDLTLLGLIGMEDPPRPEIPAAIAACAEAGIRVVMVTGDAELTAAAIARQIGLHREEPTVISGGALERLSDEQLGALLGETESLFARVGPEHKLRLVQAFQRTGAIVAVTGDGVNDAPALKLADIGVAMGVTGTDVAREAADMVLADDNFASIVEAVRMGRAVYENVRSFLTYVLSHNVPEAAAFIAFVLAGVPPPLSVMQVLAIDLGTELLPALALGAEAPEAGVMQRPPRLRRERLLDAGTMMRVYLWLGLIESALLLVGYFSAFWLGGWRPGGALAAFGPLYRSATTASFASIVACQIGNALACRSRRRSIFALGFTSNRRLIAGMGAALLVTCALVYVRPVASLFGMEPLGVHQWLVLATFAPVLLLLEETRKALTSRPSRRERPDNLKGAQRRIKQELAFGRADAVP